MSRFASSAQMWHRDESRMNWIGKTGLRFCLLNRRTFCSHEIVLHDEKDGAPKQARFFSMMNVLQS